MKKLISAFLFTIPIVINASTINISTGLGDLTWTVTQTSGELNTSTPLNTPTSAMALSPTLPPSWVLPGQLGVMPAAWVGQSSMDGNYLQGTPGSTCDTSNGQTSCGAKPGTYVYELLIPHELADGYGGGGLYFTFAGDNVVSVQVSQGGYPNYSCLNDCIASFSFGDRKEGRVSYIPGMDILIRATVVNSSLADPNQTLRNPSGFILTGTAVPLPPWPWTPEPSSLAMTSIGVSLFIFAAARRVRRNRS